jgi:hypothetical protein
MSKSPAKNPTSLGSILIEWELITEEQLGRALEEQRILRGDDLLGRLLIASGACTEEEIDAAISAQASMRAAGKCKSAMAVADLALERRRRKSVIDRRDSLIQKGERIKESITGTGQLAVSASMLAKPGDS